MYLIIYLFESLSCSPYQVSMLLAQDIFFSRLLIMNTVYIIETHQISTVKPVLTIFPSIDSTFRWDPCTIDNKSNQ